MKRTFALLSLFALLLAACATAPATPALKGVITQLDGTTLTVTPAGGQPTAVKIVAATQVYWPNNTHAGKSVLMTGQPVQVWFAEGSQNATKIVISN